MKPDEIDALPAGRELDALVSELVMDSPPPFQVVLDGTSRSRQYPTRAAAEKAKEILAKRYLVGEIEVGDDVPDYSTDIAAAWEVVEKLVGGTPRFVLVWEAQHWSATFDSGKPIWAGALTAPLVVCRAGLKAVQPVARPASRGAA